MTSSEFDELSVIIPLYNEEKTIKQILQKILSVDLDFDISLEILVVNDCSTDSSEQVVLDFISDHPERSITLISQSVNKGKGAALHKGIQNSRGQYVIIQDADLEYDPKDYNALLAPVVEGLADVVYGSRFVGSKPHRMLFFWHSVGNKMLTQFCNVFANLNLSDMETCYKLMNREFLLSLDLKEKRFGFEPEVTIKLARIPGIRFYEVGIAYYGRTFSEGKKISYKDGFRAIYCILKYGILKRI